MSVSPTFPVLFRSATSWSIFFKTEILCIFFKNTFRNPLVVQWLGLRALTARPQVHSLVRELRSRLKIKECVYVFFSFFFFLPFGCALQHAGSQLSKQSNPRPLQGKHGGLITGPPGLCFSSPLLFFYLILMIAHPTNIFFICLFFLLLLPLEWMQDEERDFNGIMLYPQRVEWHLAYCSFFINIH